MELLMWFVLSWCHHYSSVEVMSSSYSLSECTVYGYLTVYSSILMSYMVYCYHICYITIL